MKKLLVVLVAFVAVMSCKKSTTDVTPKTNMEYLTGTGTKKWIVSTGVVSNSGVSVNWNTQPPCTTDNILNLSSNLSYEVTEGATKCNATDPNSVVKGTWTYTASPAAISLSQFTFLTYTIYNPVFTISSINDQTFTGVANVVNAGKTYQITLNFTAVN